MARLAAFDMDGTLLMPDHRLGEKTLNTMTTSSKRQGNFTLAQALKSVQGFLP